MGFLAGKRLVITGLLSNRSIAYGIARACHREGAELAFSYVGERFRDRIVEFANEFGSQLVFDCDVGSDAQIEAMFDQLDAAWPQFDGFVHSIGFAPREAIAGDFLDGLSREAFRIAHDISAYSFPALAKAALPRLRPGSALLTLTYLGAERAVPNYNTMGLAKASLEASVRYLAANLGPKGIRVNGIGRTDPHAGGLGHQGLRQAAGRGGQVGAVAPQRDHRRCRQRGGLPAVRSGGRRHRRDHLCRLRLQPGGAGRGRGAGHGLTRQRSNARAAPRSAGSPPGWITHTGMRAR